MPLLHRLIALVLLASGLVSIPASPLRAQPPAPASAPAAEALAPAQAATALEVLRDDKRRSELITTLEAIATAAPKPAVTAPLAPDGLGVQLATRISATVSSAGSQLLASARSVNDLPLLWRWIAAQANDPDARAQIGDAAWKLAVVVLCALLAEWAVFRLFGRLRSTLTHWTPAGADPDRPVLPEGGLAAAEAGETELHRRRLTRALSALRRLPFLFGRLLLDILPIAAFVVVGDLLLGTRLGAPEKTRQVVLQVIQAYAFTRLALVAAALLISPASPAMRLLHLSDWAAAFLTRWTRRIVILAAAATTVTDIGLLFGMYRTAHDAVLKLFALVIHICLVIAVLQARHPVAARLRAPRHARRAWASVLNRLAEIWHLIAIFYIVALWLVWAVELRNGYVRLINFCVVTFGVLLGVRLLGIVLLGGLDRMRTAVVQGSTSGLAGRAGIYYPVVRSSLTGLLWFAAAIALLEGWGFSAIGWFEAGGLGTRAARAVMLIALTSVVAVVVWEIANTAIERHLAQLSHSAQVARAGRLRTLLPMLRTVLLITILVIVTLMALSEIGVNIAPLLAGAGVVGIAVGFGSQKLVQDLITGLFLLLENAMQVGDVVTLGGLSGTVEALSIRAIRLRALDGSVHLIPFSSVTTVTNQTRDYSYALLDISVGLNEEPDPIADLLRSVAASMQADPAWQSMVLDKLDVMGVEKLTDLAWIMRVRIKTQPGSRWAVARELNRRIKVRFDELAIESPFTSHRALGREPPVPQVAPVEEEPAA